MCKPATKTYTARVTYDFQFEADSKIEAHDHAYVTPELPEGFVVGSFIVKELYSDNELLVENDKRLF